jgi:hypothetical protein
MKTTRFLLAAGISLATAFIVSCGTHSFQEIFGNLVGDKIQQLKASNLLQNGNLGMGFVSGDPLPEGSVDVIEEVRVNGEAVEGGSTSLTIITTEKLDTLYIYVEGEDGFYVQPLNDGDCDEIEGGKYSCFVVLQFNQTLEDESLKFTISGKTASGQVAEETEKKEVKTKGAESGNLQISVSWDQFDDVDLHVWTPSGGHVYYENKEAGNAKLDFDSNPDCNIDEINSENIYIDAPLEVGEYTVEIRMFRKCNTSPKVGARYHVTANYNGKFIDFAPEKQTGKFEASATGDAKIEIGTITVRNGIIVE